MPRTTAKISDSPNSLQGSKDARTSELRRVKNRELEIKRINGVRTQSIIAERDAPDPQSCYLGYFVRRVPQVDFSSYSLSMSTDAF